MVQRQLLLIVTTAISLEGDESKNTKHQMESKKNGQMWMPLEVFRDLVTEKGIL